ncbi:mycofactocin system FadH/OYE family oxidoreductase 1 [Pseudonocardia spinosispora]|uniref:mycofactocin system FadH/OYE family oxidoreductase 1 n=1 Tax=Pseudonocardia spinosispora TaxID=103441 RepID=UPI001FE11EF6|nr:mycofactocin system FadH/OYE family oxidoreductase 1 [Pseudonocardia spinosispora]
MRGRRVPSRVLFGPIETNLGDGRAMSARHAAFYERRARGGCGLIVTEIASVHESDWPYERAPLASLCGPGWASVVEACAPHGTVVLAGIGHAGGQGSSAHHRRELWGPSRVADVVSREVPYTMEQAEIDALVGGFVAATETAVAAGCDGVECNAGQHSILRQFLSGLTNHRTDAYGTDRALLLREVLAAVRAALGPDRVLGLRLCGDELAPWAGITPASSRAVLASVAPLIDYVVPVRGSALTVSATRPDLHTAPGFNRELCAASRVPDVLMVLQGSVVDVSMASDALTDGTADLVEMTRAQLAEPSLVRLARAGQGERIRPCTLSNQHSWVRDPLNPIISDEGEPSTGHETEDEPVPRADGLEVLVVGGGPAGLETARVLANHGCRVTLVERSDRLGGALRLAAAVHGRGRWGLLADWFGAEVRRLGVRVELTTEVGLGEVDRAANVVLASGSRPSPPSFTVGDGVAVYPAAEFVAGGFELDGPVLVHDPIGDWTGVGIAEQVAAAGPRCVLVTQDPVAGTQLSRTGDLADANARLQRAGVVRELYTRLTEVRDGRARLVDVHTGESRSVECATVIDCAHRLPEDGLWPARPDLLRAGDCVAPRTVHEAVLEGRRAAHTLLRAAP